MASIIKADTLQSTTANVFVLNSVGTEYARFDSTGAFQLANPTTFPAGTAALPSITTAGDTNTGLYFPAADTIGFVEGGAEAMRIDSSGNVKLSAVNTRILNSSGNPILQQTGSVLQVVSTTKTDTFSTASTSFVDLTGFSVTITPTSTSSQILVFVDTNYGPSSTSGLSVFNLVRNSTNISQPATSATFTGTAVAYMNLGDNCMPFGFHFLDSPATTSSTTYKVQVKMNAGTLYVNRRGSTDTVSTSTITVMEIAA